MSSKQNFIRLGKFLKEQRKRLNLSQRQVAKELGYHTQFVSNMERGLCAPPLKALTILIDLYKLNPDEIVRRIINEKKIYLNRFLSGVGQKRRKAVKERKEK